jgi:hypothetical protein
MRGTQAWVALIAGMAVAFVGGAVAATTVLTGPLGFRAAGHSATRASASPSPSASPVALPSPVAGAVPPARFNAASAFDAVRGKLVIYGGITSGVSPQQLADTWTWDGVSWTLENPPSSPSLDGSQAPPTMTYDQAEGRAVMFGGTTDKTWTWDGSNWQRMAPTTNPTLSYGASTMTYDASQHRVLLFMWVGPYPAGETNQTWAWDGADWTLVATGSPNGHGSAYAAMAYHPATMKTVFFGHASDSPLTWLFDGKAWTRSVTTTGPPKGGVNLPGPGAFSMVGDEAHGTIVMYNLGDTWTWNGTSWKLQTPVTSPPDRWGQSMVYDSVHKRVLLYGGAYPATTEGFFQDLWAWDGSNWSKLSG